jgi:hypothetical protein
MEEQSDMRETVYKGRTIRAVSFRVNSGVWMPEARVVSVNKSLRAKSVFPSQELADAAALLMGKRWIDSVAHDMEKQIR